MVLVQDKLRMFWDENVATPMRQLSKTEVLLAIVVGVTCGIFPIPMTTTVVVLVVSKLLYFNAAQMALCAAVNVLCTPLQLLMIALFAKALSTVTGKVCTVSAVSVSTALEEGYIAFFLSSGAILLDSTIAWCVVAIPVIVGCFFAQRNFNNKEK